MIPALVVDVALVVGLALVVVHMFAPDDFLERQVIKARARIVEVTDLLLAAAIVLVAAAVLAVFSTWFLRAAR